MRTKIQMLGTKVAAVASVIGLYALHGVRAVDPTLTDVATTFTTHVSAILTFIVAVVGGFIAAMLVPGGLRALYRLIMRLLGRAGKA